MKKLIAIFFLAPFLSLAQGEIVDKIIGVVGDEIILYSDVKAAILERSQGKTTVASPAETCAIYEDLLYQKLLLNQSRLDSIEVADAEVDMQVDRRISYFVQMFGSTEQ